MTYIVPSNVHLGESVKTIAFGTRLDDFLEGQVHPRVAIDQVAVERLAVLELHEHWVALRGGEEAERKLWR